MSASYIPFTFTSGTYRAKIRAAYVDVNGTTHSKDSPEYRFTATKTEEPIVTETEIRTTTYVTQTHIGARQYGYTYSNTRTQDVPMSYEGDYNAESRAATYRGIIFDSRSGIYTDTFNSTTVSIYSVTLRAATISYSVLFTTLRRSSIDSRSTTYESFNTRVATGTNTVYQTSFQISLYNTSISNKQPYITSAASTETSTNGRTETGYSMTINYSQQSSNIYNNKAKKMYRTFYRLSTESRTTLETRDTIYDTELRITNASQYTYSSIEAYNIFN